MSGFGSNFKIRAEHLDGVVRLHTAGDLDIAVAHALDEALAFVETLEPTTIILDFKDVQFIDSSGLHALVLAHERANQVGRMLVVLNGADGVRKVFELTGLDHMFEPASASDPEPALTGDGAVWAPIAIPRPIGG